ncbi:MAG: MlaD family protein [Tepidisphaeraceae bacterium]
MSSERNALKAGLFIVTSVALILAVIVGIKGIGRFLEPMERHLVRFKLSDDIGGLAVGDDVRIGGAKVGTVRDIDIQTEVEDPGILISFDIPRKFAVKKDALATIQTTVTGVSVLNFESLGKGEPLAESDILPGATGGSFSVLAAKAGELIPELLGAVRDVRQVTIPKVNNAVDKTTDTVVTFKGTGEAATDLFKHVRSKIDPIVERYNTIVDKGSGAMVEISSLFGDTKTDFRGTVANLNAATGTVKERLPGLIDKVESAMDKTNVALEDIQATAASGRGIVVGNRSKIESMIASLKATGENLKNASAEIRRSPWRLLYKPGPGEMANLNLYDSARQFAEGAGAMEDAATALRDALKDPNVEPQKIEFLVEKLDKSFANFTQVESQLWQQVRP